MKLQKDIREFVELLLSEKVEMLIRNKLATGRTQDRADAERLSQ